MDQLSIDIKEKLAKLEDGLLDMQKVVVTYSGGVDSSFLAFYANEILGRNAIALMFTTQVHTATEIKEAFDFAHQNDFPLETITIDVLNSEVFKTNPRNRCYHCKLLLFKHAQEYAQKHRYKYVVDGSNTDDLNDYRPGAKALQELGVRSPLQEAGLSKSEIRELSRHFNLHTWDKEAMACLATRIPYGENISCAKLNLVAEAESIIRSSGFKMVRARLFEPRTLRIEVAPNQVKQALKDYQAICLALESFKFDSIEIDENGYIQGSLNSH